MMGNIEYIQLDSDYHLGWYDVAELFTRMYASMDEMGLMLPLDEGGTAKWLKSAQNTSGKFGVVILATDGGQAIGFAHGMLKFLPDYLGGHAVGTITHLFVEEDERRSGVGRQLVHELEEWFRQKKVQSVELQVITGNAVAQEFWTDLGYKPELLQFRKNYER
ncbi:MAG: GNAT family N-acetyltransferase [Bacteroidales bacterium]|jgi:GNAT superfamily N-acetyltransferase|nr:GNAT family N-acetyltransferase [Bacteroidales bacterium]